MVSHLGLQVHTRQRRRLHALPGWLERNPAEMAGVGEGVQGLQPCARLVAGVDGPAAREGGSWEGPLGARPGAPACSAHPPLAPAREGSRVLRRMPLAPSLHTGFREAAPKRLSRGGAARFPRGWSQSPDQLQPVSAGSCSETPSLVCVVDSVMLTSWPAFSAPA